MVIQYRQKNNEHAAHTRRLWTKSYSPPQGGRIALSANERIAEFLDFAIQARFAYVNKLGRAEMPVRFYMFCSKTHRKFHRIDKFS